MEYELVLADESALEAVYGLIDQRIRWMDEKGIAQWNVMDYWGAYPREHYAELMRRGELYVLKRPDRRIVSAAALYEEDERWVDAAELPAFYVHHFTSDVHQKGAGRAMLRKIEALARERGKACIRLDCSDDNARLNRYYEDVGYLPAGFCTDGPYRGIRREKGLK